MTKKTNANLMRVSLNKSWNLEHNAQQLDIENILFIQTKIIRNLLLGNPDKLLRDRKHMFPHLKWIKSKYQGKKSVMNIKQEEQSIMLASRDATVYDVKCKYNNIDKITLNVLAKKPNILIGREGKTLNNIVQFISKLIDTNKENITVNIQDSNEPNPVYLAKEAAKNLENRMSYSSVVNNLIQSAKDNIFVDGFQVKISGKLNGSAIARSESSKFGNINKSSLNKNIVECHEEAFTVHGVMGVKITMSINNNAAKNNNMSNDLNSQASLKNNYSSSFNKKQSVEKNINNFQQKR